MKAEAEQAKETEDPVVYARFDAAALLEAARTIKGFSDEVGAEIGPGGLSVTTIDPAHIAWLHLTLPAAEGPTDGAECGLDADRLAAFLKRVRSGSLAGPSVDLSVRRGQVTARVGRISDRFRALDFRDYPRPDEPKVASLPASATFNARPFLEALKILGEAQDYVCVKLQDGLEAFADGEDEATYRVEPAELRSFVGHPKARSAFPVSYLIVALEAHAEHDGEITIHVGQDYPILMEWDAGGGEVRVLIAPRIVSED